MIRTSLLVALAAVVLVGTGGLAGAVAADAGPGENASDDAGPPSDLPEPVPDFVSDILGTIGDFLGGALDGLGDAVSGIAGGS